MRRIHKNSGRIAGITSAFLLLLKKSVQRIITIHLIGLFLLFFSLKGGTVTLSENADVSILTCGPSKMIHAIYGHTAIRVKDPAFNLDVVFNYGVFSFSKPNFIYRFAKGQTDYMLAPERYSGFYEEYISRGRSIHEQVLDLNMAEKQGLWDFLVENAKPENREYRYNFFYDNCATRVRDVIKTQVDGVIDFPGTGEGMTFRQHITHYQKVLPWTDFGIHLVLGSPADRVATAFQEMFLPDFLMKHFGNAQLKTNSGTRPLVKETRTLYEPEREKQPGFNLFAPTVVLAFLFLIIVLVSISQFRQRKENYLADYILLFITGLIGFVLLWFVTVSEHPAVQANYNLMWAIPANLLFMFAWMIEKWRPAIRWYWVLLAGWLTVFLLFHFLVPQSFHPGFYLIVLMLLCRAILHTVRLYRRPERQEVGTA